MMKRNFKWYKCILTHWGREIHICASKPTIIDSDKNFLPDRHQAIIWTNVGILLTGPLRTNFSEILIEIYMFSFKKRHLKMSGIWRLFCLGLNMLQGQELHYHHHHEVYRHEERETLRYPIYNLYIHFWLTDVHTVVNTDTLSLFCNSICRRTGLTRRHKSKYTFGMEFN